MPRRVARARSCTLKSGRVSLRSISHIDLTIGQFTLRVYACILLYPSKRGGVFASVEGLMGANHLVASCQSEAGAIQWKKIIATRSGSSCRTRRL